ncbi:hypothetical protein CPC08DRAFT_816468 [Agrocybe pediades]|nr:hypothetical protein CPC08DRAFT_816468 [Agrocybe pediades]
MAASFSTGSTGSPPFQDFSLTSTDHIDPMASPSQLAYPPFPNPLMLPREWPDNYYSSASAGEPLYDHYDFQSNHLDATWLNSDSSYPTAGLGIRNLDLIKDLDPLAYTPFALDGSYVQSLPERRAISTRTHRTESVYDSYGRLGEEYDPLGQAPRATSSLGSPWSFSSMLKVAELVTETPRTTDAVQASSSSMGLGGVASAPDDDSGIDLDWSFEKLSAATGLSVADLAAQISATAETTLRRMSELGYDEDPQALSTQSNGVLGRPEVPSWLEVDIHMRDMNGPWNSEMGVNPADILPPSLPPTPMAAESSETPFSREESILQDTVVEGVADDYTSQYALPSGQSSPYEAPFHQSQQGSSRQQSEYVFPSPEEDTAQLPSPSSSSEYCFIPPPQPSTSTKRCHASSSRVATRRKTRKSIVDDSDLPYGEYSADADQDQEGLPPIDLGTPVFDAHRGMDLEELKAKAERYRLRNQGRDYDKRWLISFAGKLSPKGELVDEFRCYVTGCKQSNKRRDHILIHVGAHLDQRPFKCIHCSARFLRKNECKRHELSHTGIRPFSCHLCPSPTITFVRQDLLKRHMKRTHRQDLKADKENSRPKKRARH